MTTPFHRLRLVMAVLLGMLVATMGCATASEERSDFGRYYLAAKSGLGTARKNIRDYLQNVGDVPREPLVEDLESAGLKKGF